MLICHLESKIKESGLRKSFIADHINVTVRQLRKYETMDSIAPIDKAFMLADILNCNFEDIYEWKKVNKEA
ncbi:helix-turn-helix domain-containing protein [Niallia taxi]|uniref:XRE family transcriptional regulator n=1 Tax=Niallia taxi TaxID=2499688 RepID=A0A3S2UZ55_9BACI|nr:helix-turn-helix transcriptional regulator [Niallia taxi]RVT67638.1 XRE family transcriptional regulator [Niallia taxi]